MGVRVGGVMSGGQSGRSHEWGGGAESQVGGGRGEF